MSPETIILLIVDYRAAIGEKTPPPLPSWDDFSGGPGALTRVKTTAVASGS